VFQLLMGHPAGDRLSAALTGEGPEHLLRVCVPYGPALRRAGALVAVRQRAQQCRLDLVGQRAGLRRPAPGDASSSQGSDPTAAVVLGGAPYMLPASTPDSPERQFYGVLLRDGRDAFDIFDLHLYGPAEQIVADIETVRSMIRAVGYESRWSWVNTTLRGQTCTPRRRRQWNKPSLPLRRPLTAQVRRLSRRLLPIFTNAWPACRRNSRCSCVVVRRRWRPNGIGSTVGATLRCLVDPTANANRGITTHRSR